jgi:hypothetical protein
MLFGLETPEIEVVAIRQARWRLGYGYPSALNQVSANGFWPREAVGSGDYLPA